jgi:1,4-alpha-glucan branching enzyme
MYLNPETAVKNILDVDGWLTPYSGDLKLRVDRYNEKVTQLGINEGKVKDVADGHLYFGLHKVRGGWVFREWLPGADAAFLTGDFNGWHPYSHPLTQIGNGVWEIKLKGKDAMRHGQYYKLVVGRLGQSFERLPAYVPYARQDPNTNKLCAVVWEPEKKFRWTDKKYFENKSYHAPMIYEAHVGMAQEYGGIGTYREFADNILQRVSNLGYNTIQLMAIQEHPYYASFGYQVTNFFAPSSRFGSPDELKYLINKAHSMGIAVLLDVVHSHACPNVGEGLNFQDGTEDQYFLPGGRGNHSAWGTKIFDYGKTEVLRFLLSNLRYWLEEFHFDGFRFDGVTSMCYEDHALGSAFTDYSMYFSMNTNIDALNYLMLANSLIHDIDPHAVTIAEEMSGMPGMCLPLEKAGIGFDYRLAMGVPDMWIKLIKESRFEDWNMFHIWGELTGCRPQEKNIGYCESHDQALVGDKTIMFRLVDAEMYTGMEKSYHSLTMDTAIDLHKIIRFITLTLAGDGYLNFMGNEFGHPEWIDFPREGNGWSYHYCRRQWSLAMNPDLKYEWLDNFDKGMVHMAEENHILENDKPQSLWIDPDKKIIAFARNGLIFVVNLHTTFSDTSFFVPTAAVGDGKYQTIFTSDEPEYGGQAYVDKNYVYESADIEDRGHGFCIYIPCRTAVVLKKID